MKTTATLLSAVALVAAGPAYAQASASAAPQPAMESSIDGSAQFGNSTAAYVVAAIVLGGLIYGFIQFMDNDDDGDEVPVSP